MHTQDEIDLEQAKLVGVNGKANGLSKLPDRGDRDDEKANGKQAELDNHLRLVKKNGTCNVRHKKVSRRLDFLRDGFTTVIDLKWRWVLLIFSFTYVIGWLVFAGFWYALAWDHGDIGYKQRDLEWEPCVANVENFKGAFLFSIETQTTIGYGFRSVTEACWMGWFLVVLQSVFSCLVDVVMTGCVFVKLARPKKRAATIMFSENATIAERGGKLCLMFRVGNVRQSHMYDVKIRAHLVKRRFNLGGKCLQIETHKLILEDNMFLIWPMVIVHEINEKSPLYELSEPMLKGKTSFGEFEIIVFLEGILEQTGLMMQARTSYLSSEVLWGHAFNEFATPKEDHKYLTIDYRKFNSTCEEEGTTGLSAKERRTSAQQMDDNCTIPSETYSDLRKSNSFENNNSIQDWKERACQEQESGYDTVEDIILETVL